MKLYVHDESWRGASIFAADSAELAAEQANALGYKINVGPHEWRDYQPTDFDEYELKPGLILETLGDR